jgi:hypothetical protein
VSFDGSKAAPGVLAVATIAMAWAGPNLSPWWVLGAYAALFLPWFFLLQRRAEVRLWHLVVAAAVTRVALAFAEPLLSDDLYRYVWDGRVWASGINPFEHPPAADALAHLRDASIWPKINHPEIPTIYPPMAQYVFGLNGLVGGGTTTLKLLLLAAEAAGLAAAWHWFGRRRQRWDVVRDLLVIYALNPLVLVEVAWSGHVDVLAWTPMAAAIVVWMRSDGWKGAIAAACLLGVSVSAKFLGLLALPLLLLVPDDDRPLVAKASLARRGLLIGVAAIVVAATYLPFAGAGSQLFGGFNTYASAWRGNDGPYRAAYVVALDDLRGVDTETHPHAERDGEKVIYRYKQYDERFEQLGWTRTWQGEQVPATSFAAEQIAQQIAKAWSAVMVLLALLWAVVMVRDPMRGTLVVLGVLLFVAPVVHPWYVAWLVPLAALLRMHGTDSRHYVGGVGSPAALVFSSAVLVAYLGWAQALSGGTWYVPSWAVTVEFGLVAAVAVWSLVDSR